MFYKTLPNYAKYNILDTMPIARQDKWAYKLKKNE